MASLSLGVHDGSGLFQALSLVLAQESPCGVGGEGCSTLAHLRPVALRPPSTLLGN